MIIQPYLFFDGRCEEALEFYQKAVGARIEMMMRFSESPEPTMHEVPGDKIMHAGLYIGDSLIMASDGYCSGKEKFQGFSLALTVSDEAEADKVFAALTEGGSVQLPLTKTFFSPRFGMATDRFGVAWMIMVEKKS